MKKWLFGFSLGLIFPAVVFAAKLNTKYSNKDFTHKTFTDRPASEFNNSIIFNTCFYQEKDVKESKIWLKVFPDDMTGVTFKKCNLDNVFIPLGNTVDKSCTHRIIKVQNGRNDWILYANGTAKEPLRKSEYIKLGISIDPKDIPVTIKEVEIIEEKELELLEVSK